LTTFFQIKMLAIIVKEGKAAHATFINHIRSDRFSAAQMCE